jgi:hypothetical protein
MISNIEYFDPDYVRRVLEEHIAGKRDRSRLLMMLLVVGLWHRLYVQGPLGAEHAMGLGELLSQAERR